MPVTPERLFSKYKDSFVPARQQLGERITAVHKYNSEIPLNCYTNKKGRRKGERGRGGGLLCQSL